MAQLYIKGIVHFTSSATHLLKHGSPDRRVIPIITFKRQKYEKNIYYRQRMTVFSRSDGAKSTKCLKRFSHFWNSSFFFNPFSLICVLSCTLQQRIKHFYSHINTVRGKKNIPLNEHVSADYLIRDKHEMEKSGANFPHRVNLSRGMTSRYVRLFWLSASKNS